LTTGEKISGTLDLAKILSGQKKEQFARSFAEKLLMYAIGRGIEFPDKCAVDEIMKSAAKEDYRFSSIVEAIVHSTPFQKMRNVEMRAK
jgi:hypothetical protein